MTASATTISILGVVFHLMPIFTISLLFSDDSARLGLDYGMGPTLKYGGASICDLDGDGWPDLLFTHHDSTFVEVYFNDINTAGKFSKSSFPQWHDTHGLNGFRISPWRKTLHFSLSRGGAYGTDPNPPIVFRVFRNRTIVDETSRLGLASSRGRGRSAIFMSLRPFRNWFRSTDVIFSNAGAINRSEFDTHQNAFRGENFKTFKPEKLQGYASNPNWYVAAVDTDNDGQMEVASFHDLMIFKVVRPFELEDMSQPVLPDHLDYRGTVAVAELDFDNDGRWDLYVARTRTGDLQWLPHGMYSDYLLRNVGGRYEDVSKQVGLPLSNGLSRGVTTGDFNNDGFVDLVIAVFDKQDYILINENGITFTREFIGSPRIANVPGDMVTAVDFDKDGRLDLVVSEGHTHDTERGGYFKLLRNKLVLSPSTNFLLVDVGSAPGRLATSLHAVVSVSVAMQYATSSRKVISFQRRVGSPGTAVSNSYIETVHFGIGSATSVLLVKTTWVDGSTQIAENVAANSIVRMGVFWKD